MLRELTIMKDYFDLKGRVAIVTGCSGGLGVQMAKALANQGCNIVPVARRLEKIERTPKSPPPGGDFYVILGLEKEVRE